MKFKTLLSILFFALHSFFAMAQYEEMRVFQTQEEMVKFKALKVREQIVTKLESEKETPHIHRYYDTEGRLKREVKGNLIKNFKYDFRNRVIMIIDSVFVDGYYERDDYEFEFDGRGLLSFVRFPYFNSSFNYDKDKKELTESTQDHPEAYRIRHFRFDDKMRVHEEEFFYNDGTKEKYRKIHFDTSGKIVQEDIRKYYQNGSRDSVFIYYQYNERGLLEIKKTDETNLVIPADFAELPLIPHFENISSVFNYFYDKHGNLLEEAFTYADNSFGYRIGAEYNDKNLKTKENHFDYEYNLKQSLHFKYKFGR